MLPFFCLFAYLGIAQVLSLNINSIKTRRLFQAYFGGLGLWLLLALRAWTCGNDLYVPKDGIGYIPLFCSIQKHSLFDMFSKDIGYEKGYNIINWLIGRVSINPQFFLAIVGLICISLIGYTLYKKSPNIIFSYFVFVCMGLYVFSFSGLRQAIAISLCFLAFNFINQKRPIKFILLVLLAFSIHTSAITFLLALFFRYKKLNKNVAIKYLFFIILLIPFMVPLLQLGAEFIYGYKKYADDDGGAYGLCLLYLLFFCFSYFPQYNIKERLTIYLVRWMTLVAVALQSAGIFSAGALPRIAYYFSMFFCLLLPMTIHALSMKDRVISSIALVVFLIAFFIYSNHSGYLNVVPYQFFWEASYRL